MPSRQTDKDSTQIRTYKYGLVPKGYVSDTAIDELYRSNKLWNRLVELHNENWNILEQTRKDASPPYAEITARAERLTTKIDNAYTHRRTLRVDAGSTKGDDPKTIIIDKNINELKKQRSDLWSDLKKERKIANTLIDFKALNKNRRDAFNEAVRSRNSMLGSATANEVKKNFDDASEKLMKKPGSGRLRFHRFDGTGYWHYRFRSNGSRTDGITFGELFEDNTQSKKNFMFVDCDDSRKKPRLRLRAKLAGGRTAASRTYQEFDLILHRPLPDGAQIQNGKILRTRTGDKFRYDLVLTVKLPRQGNRSVPHDNALGIDINFRYNAEGIDVMTFASLDGKILGTIKVPPKYRTKYPTKYPKAPRDYIDSTKSELDQSATDLGDKIKPLLKKMSFHEKLPSQDIDKLDDAARDQYHYERRCASVVNAPANVTLSFEKAYKLATGSKRHPNILSEEVTHHIINWWKGHGRRYRELHNFRAKQLRKRNDSYRQAAARIISHGLLISFEKNFLAKIAKVKDQNNKLGARTRANRVASSPSALVAAIKNAAEREGIPWVDIPPQYTSKTCHRCGKVNRMLSYEKKWNCPSCKFPHDRDENAANNIARLGLEKYNKTHDK